MKNKPVYTLQQLKAYSQLLLSWNEEDVHGNSAFVLPSVFTHNLNIWLLYLRIKIRVIRSNCQPRNFPSSDSGLCFLVKILTTGEAFYESLPKRPETKPVYLETFY